MSGRGILKAAKRWLVLGHRWLGIGTGLLFALWVASGLVMLHVPFPRLTEAERLAHLPPIAWDRVAVAPDAAIALIAAGNPAEQPIALALEMRGDEPVYRMTAPDGAPVTISARTGQRRAPVTDDEALRIAGADPVRASVSWIERDQWTVTARYDPLRPFRTVALGDPDGTELYVSIATGAVALDTTRFERGWNWVGAVVHWVYLTPLRARPDLWREVVLWLSGIACFTALSGLTTGLWRLRLRRRYRDGAVSPYRGAARWHHLFGLAAGLSLCSFIVSGWLSMNPNRWFTSPTPPPAWRAASAGPARPLSVTVEALRALAPSPIAALDFARLGGRWLVTLRAPGEIRTLDLLEGTAPREAAIVAAIAQATGDFGPARIERLRAYDAYWYPNPDPPALPVLRLRFADPDGTWLHVDPASGAMLSRLDRSGRLNRWLFSGLHRLDILGLGENRPARLALQWPLNALAALIAATGLLLGWRRLSRRGAASRPPSAPG